MTTKLTRDEVLVLLTEESAEVIQATTKIQRFGWSHCEPGYGLNSRKLAQEIGDLLGIIDRLSLDFTAADKNAMKQARESKMTRALAVKQKVIDRDRIAPAGTAR